MALPALLLALALACMPSAGWSQEGLDAATKALFQAVELNDMAGVEKSLANGADPTAHNARNQTPADLAVEKGHFKIAHFLLSKRNGTRPKTATAKATPAPKTATPSAAAKPPAETAELPPLSAAPEVPAGAAAPAPKKAMPEPPATQAATPPPPALPVPAKKPAPAPPRIATLPPELPAAPPAQTRPTPAPAAPSVAPAEQAAPPAVAKQTGPAAAPKVASAPAAPSTPPAAATPAQKQPTKPTAETQKKGSGFWSKVADAVTPWFLKGSNKPKQPATTAQPTPQPPPREGSGTTDRMMKRLGSLVGGKDQQEDVYGLPKDVAITPPPEPAAPPTVARAGGSESTPSQTSTPAPAAQPSETASTGEAAAPPEVQTAPAETAPGQSEPATPSPSEAAQLPPPPASPPSTREEALADSPPPADNGLPALPPLPGDSGAGLPPLPAPTPGAPTQVRKPLETPRSMAEGPISPTTSPAAPPSAAVAPAPPASPAAPVEAQPQPSPGRQLPQKIAIPDQPMTPETTTSERIGRLGDLLDRQVRRDPAAILKEGRKLPSGLPVDAQRLRMPSEGELKRSQSPEPPSPDEVGKATLMGTPETPSEAKSASSMAAAEAKAAPGTEQPAPAATAAPAPAPAAAEAPTAKPKPLPERRPSPEVGPQDNQPGTPASRLLARLTGKGEKVYTAEDQNGLPLAMPSPTSSTASSAGAGAGAGKAGMSPAQKQNLDKLAAFFGADDPALGVRKPEPIRREQLPAPDPGIIDTLKHDPNAALDQTVPDSMLDLGPYETSPASKDGQARAPAKEPSPAFMDKLAAALTPKDLPVAKPQPAGDTGGPQKPAKAKDDKLGINQLDVPQDQLKPDQPPTEEPWTMSVQQPTPDGGDRTLVVSSIDPKSGDMQSKKPDTGIVAGMMDKVKELFAAGDGKDNKQQQDAIKLNDSQRLDTAERLLTDALRAERPTALPPSDQWPVTEVRTAPDLPGKPQKPPEAAMGGVPLVDVNLALGESVTLNNTVPPGKNGTDPSNECIKKNRGTTLFCIEPVDWPPAIRPTFVVPTILYTGPQAIVRYDQGTATRFHALFPSDKYDNVVAYFQKRYGEPTDIWKRSIAPLAKPREDNPTVAWRSRDSSTNAVTVLEVRKFDDTRGGFPDTTRGAVMLYYENAPTIFPQVSSHELMRLRDRYE